VLEQKQIDNARHMDAQEAASARDGHVVAALLGEESNVAL
jgi:hypothetical protein